MKTFLAVSTAALGLALTGCAPATEVTSTPDDAGGDPSKRANQTAKVGSQITLTGMEKELKIAVKVARVIRNAKGKDEFNRPEKGSRFVAVQIVLKNVGTQAYDDSPTNGAKLIDADDQQYDADFSEIAAGPFIGSAVKIAPGNSRKGFIVFLVPKTAKLAKFQFTLDSGFAGQSGEWALN